MSSLMKCTDPSQKAKNTPPGCGLLKPSVHILSPGTLSCPPVHGGVRRDKGMAQGPIRAPHIRAGRIAVANPGGSQTTPVSLADQECAAGPIRDTLGTDVAVSKEDTVGVTSRPELGTQGLEAVPLPLPGHPESIIPLLPT